MLQSGDYPAGSAFSSLNLATQSGMKSLTPYKELAEQTLVDMFINVLNWIHFTGDKVDVYAPKRVTKEQRAAAELEGLTGGGAPGGGPGGGPLANLPEMPTADVGVDVIQLDNSFFDIENVYLEVELTEDVPTDFMSKINAAGMMVERLNTSYQDALEFVGETDPQATMKLREAENLRLADNQSQTQRIINEANLEIMDMQRQIAQQLQQVQQMRAELEQQMAQAQQAGGQGGVPQGPGAMPGPGQENLPSPEMQQLLAMRRGQAGPPNPNEGVFPGGEGNNPAAGGGAPIQAAPGMGLREATQEATGEGE